MAAIFLRESDVSELLTMPQAIEAVRGVFRRHAMTEVANIPRGRARTDHCMLHLMGASVKALGVMGTKTYTTSKEGAKFLFHLYDGKNGDLLAVIEADQLGRIRTGAVSGLATSLMALPDASTVGLLGTGKQARTQLEAVCHVRDIVEAYVYSTNAENRQRFADEMTAHLGIKVLAAVKPELAVEDKDVVITATNSAIPVLQGEWLRQGAHVNAVGSNFLGKAELDIETVRRADPIVVEDKEQARLEAGDFVKVMEEGIIRWADILELSTVLVGRAIGRHNREDVTIFKSVGVAFCDVAVAKVVYDTAVERGVGEKLPF